MNSFLIRSGSFLIPFLLLLQPSLATSTEKPEPKIQAHIEFSSREDYERFLSIPNVEILSELPDLEVRIVTEREQLNSLRSEGFSLQVEIEDMQEYYASRIKGDNFGAFHTYSETEDFLDDLHMMHPSITTEKISIGLTHEGRDLWAMKISDNPGIDENEPEILFDALHHAREPITVEVVIHYMRWLCQSYGSDQDATFLVDNREIWFVPIVNPDGTVYNEDIAPGGGGMWRKNRRDNGDGTFGVDLNRNYPFQWGVVNPQEDTADDRYLGPAPASEPETQAMIGLMTAREFVSHLTFHSVVGNYSIPWSYTAEQPPDQELIEWWVDHMKRYNGYYLSDGGGHHCGTTHDYAYGEQVDKNKIISTTVEVAGSGFWPEEWEIPQLCQEHLWPQVMNSRCGGIFIDIIDYELQGGDGNGQPDAGEFLDLVVTMENQSLWDGAVNARISLHTDDAYICLLDVHSTLGVLSPGEILSNENDPLRIYVDPSVPDGHPLSLELQLQANMFSYEKQIVWIVGEPDTLFHDNFENGFDKWTVHGGTWDITDQSYHSPDHCVTDSPDGDYIMFTDAWIQCVDPFDFSMLRAVDLDFWHRYMTEEGNDFCFVEASMTNGSTWWPTGLRFHGAQNEWTRERLSLDRFVGEDSVNIRFRIKTGWPPDEDGWYVDDVVILGSSDDNVPPSVPVVISPENGSIVYSSTPTLIIRNSTDPDNEVALTYGFFLYGDEYCTDLLTSVSGIEEGVDSTSWNVDVPLEDGTYYWRAYADDGIERGLLSSVTRFTMEELGADPAHSDQIVLHPPQPNPFRKKTRIKCDLQGTNRVLLSVHDIQGRKVRTLIDGRVQPGSMEYIWKGLDDKGNPVASGLYMIHLRMGNSGRQRRVVVLR